MRSRLLVLGWHNVAPTPTWPFPDGSGLHGFERQLDFLGRVANIVPLGEALESLARGERLPRRAVAITFDDGYRDNLELAVPALERRGMPATFFLVPGLLSRRADAWWERAGWAVHNATAKGTIWDDEPIPGDPAARWACVRKVHERLKSLDRGERDRRIAQLIEATRPEAPFPDDLFLDWDGARSLSERGFEIGSHTDLHPILSREHPADQRRELAAARDALQEGLGRPVSLLAYPNGSRDDYDATTLAAAQATGYRFAVTTQSGWNDATTPTLELRRTIVPVRSGVRGLIRALVSNIHQVRSEA